MTFSINATSSILILHRFSFTGLQIIKLDFVRFDVDNWANYPTRPMHVYDGATSTSKLLGKFGGSTLPTAILSSNSTLFVSFQSHYKYHLSNMKGFEIKYTALEFNNGKW